MKFKKIAYFQLYRHINISSICTLVVCLAGSAVNYRCSYSSLDMNNYPCDSNGVCLEGYACDQTSNLCVRQDVEQNCTIGQVYHCASCENDCSKEIQNAIPACILDSSNQYTCTYVGYCSEGYQDADRMKYNGCETSCTNIRSEVCDGKDNDCNGPIDDVRTSDLFAQCQTISPNGHVDTWLCQKGACVVDSCRTGFVDQDKNVGNGCECALNNDGIEICNGQDDDCDGLIDNMTSAQADCAQTYPNAQAVSEWQCIKGQCDIIGCAENKTNADQKADNGCEEDCVIDTTNGGIERCDNQDNDCDGLKDNMDLQAINTECTAKHTDATHVQEWACELGNCVVATCEGNQYNADQNAETGCEYWCIVSNNGVEICDAKDNDCDSLKDAADDGLLAWDDCRERICNPTIEPNCDNVTEWICNHAGGCEIISCNANSYDLDNNPANGCEFECYSQGAEVCDNEDDDCDGVIDNDLENCGCKDGAMPSATEICYNNIDDNCNEQIEENCCASIDIGLAPSTCNAGEQNVVLMNLHIFSACNNTLQSIQFSKHPYSNTTQADLINPRLYLDINADGQWDAGDTEILASCSVDQNVQIDCQNINLALVATNTQAIMLIANKGASSSYLAVKISDPSDITFAIEPLNKNIPPNLTSHTHSLSKRLCEGSISDLGNGSQSIIGAETIEGPGTNEWDTGHGNESGWALQGDADAEKTSDCNLQTAGQNCCSDDHINLSDDGDSSLFLHINTGIPLGLPLCEVNMKVVAVRYDPNNTFTCSHSLFRSFQRAYFYPYKSNNEIETYQELVIDCNNAPPGPDMTMFPFCRSDYLQIDLLPLYQWASNVCVNCTQQLAYFQVRMIVDSDNDLDTSGGNDINAIPEIYMNIVNVP